MTYPIIVTGPQRSGTRIASHIIANDTGRLFVDELDYTISIPNNAVVQAPFLLKSVLELSFMLPHIKIAFMYRNPVDIVKSMERIEWQKDYINNPDFYSLYVEHCYSHIEQLKKELPKDRWFDIIYEDLAGHPMFVADRTGFGVKQYKIDQAPTLKSWRNDECGV